MGDRFNVHTYKTGKDGCGTYRLDYLCVDINDTSNVPVWTKPQACSAKYFIFEGICVATCEFRHYEWEGSQYCVRMCPPLYVEQGEKICKYDGKEIEKIEGFSFYQNGKNVKSCTDDYLTPSNSSRNQCQLICSNGEYYSDGLCLYECDELEYLGLHGNCHGCLNANYDGGDCLDVGENGSEKKCAKEKRLRTSSTTFLQRKLT